MTESVWGAIYAVRCMPLPLACSCVDISLGKVLPLVYEPKLVVVYRAVGDAQKAVRYSR